MVNVIFNSHVLEENSFLFSKRKNQTHFPKKKKSCYHLIIERENNYQLHLCIYNTQYALLCNIFIGYATKLPFLLYEKDFEFINIKISPLI